jgi:hypothetical protein
VREEVRQSEPGHQEGRNQEEAQDHPQAVQNHDPLPAATLPEVRVLAGFR